MCFLGYAGNVINEYNQSACLVLARCYPAMRDGSPRHQAHVDWCHSPYAVVKQSSLISIYMSFFVNFPLTRTFYRECWLPLDGYLQGSLYLWVMGAARFALLADVSNLTDEALCNVISWPGYFTWSQVIVLKDHWI